VERKNHDFSFYFLLPALTLTRVLDIWKGKNIFLFFPTRIDFFFSRAARFVERTNKPRFRFMSSYLQIIVNELILRGKDSNVAIGVVFEPGVHKFDVCWRKEG
jgi:hypothetical protein